MLQVKDLSYEIKKQIILQDVSLEVREGEFVGIIGPNGSGKSTLLKNIYKVLRPGSGSILLKEENLLTMSNRRMANHISVVAQESGANFDFTVEEVVQMGRYSKKSLLETANEEDKGIVKQALMRTGMEAFKDRSFLTLSGGEKQRVLIARSFAQETEMIILDEPTNHLDAGSQMKILTLLKNSGKTVLAALHDLALAGRFCDRIYVLQKGRVDCSGTPSAVISDELIRRLYETEANVFRYKEKMYIDYQ